jgi:hypothetical protein
MKKIVTCAAMMAIATLPVHAEKITKSADFLSNKKAFAYVASSSMMQIFYRLGVEQDKKLGLQFDCKSRYEVLPLVPFVVAPIDFPEDKQNPTEGAWIMRYTLSRCGDAKTYNALFLASADGGLPKYQAYYPGSTAAGAVLVRDAMLTATVNALLRSEIKDCKTADVFDMKVTEMPHTIRDGEKEFKGVWNETWSFKACDRAVDVPITFTPDIGGGGVSFTIKLR